MLISAILSSIFIGSVSKTKQNQLIQTKKTIGHSACFIVFAVLILHYHMMAGSRFSLLFYCITWLFLCGFPVLMKAQIQDSLKVVAPSVNKSPTQSELDSARRRNDKTILNLRAKKYDNSLDFKMNFAGHHLHKAGRNVIAVGGILISSVAAVLLFNSVFKPKEPEDVIPINIVYGGLGLSFLLCSTKGGYHLVKAGKSLKDPRFFKQDKTIYE
jgi:hypothetical protein